jgi:hypothetical protein
VDTFTYLSKYMTDQNTQENPNMDDTLEAIIEEDVTS